MDLVIRLYCISAYLAALILSFIVPIPETLYGRLAWVIITLFAVFNIILASGRFSKELKNVELEFNEELNSIRRVYGFPEKHS